MQQITRVALYSFLIVFVLTAIVSLIGLTYSWFFLGGQELPLLSVLVTAVLLETVAVVFLFVKKSLKYSSEIQVDKSLNDTLRFMEDFISSGTSATIVSNMLWHSYFGHPKVDC